MDIIKKKKKNTDKHPKKEATNNPQVYQLGKRFDAQDVPFYARSNYQNKSVKHNRNLSQQKKYKKQSTATKRGFFSGLDLNRGVLNFGLSMLLAVVLFSSIFFVQKGFRIKERVLGISTGAYSSLDEAVEGIKSQDFTISSRKFEEAYSGFSDASQEVDGLGVFLTEVSQYFPYLSQLSSGKNLLEAGKNISSAGKHLSTIAEKIYQIKEEGVDKYDNSILLLFEDVQKDLYSSREYIKAAEQNLNEIKIDDVPEEKRAAVLDAKSKIGTMSIVLDNLLDNSDILVDLFGGNGPRKYLFLFQNNNEMRATGGFIGSYGLVDVNRGQIRKFFIDGIFNPDGQMIDRIVPPKPIQKISAAWSLHDSNWFPDFPLSARKAMAFYEKTGGPTVDGVITFTPVVMQRMLEVTGPIYMEEYGVTIDSKNFIEKIQYEVEIDYDKEENEPKKILADLAPVVLEKLINSNDLPTIIKTLEVFNSLVKEKHILVYSSNNNLQGIVSELGWSGEILDNSLDYLNVINTNINGYKTDGVVDEKIEHTSEIREDGSVINTIVIERRHNGGDTNYEWWNKVNSDYMRVYVPQGSQLLSVEGQTKELNDSPVDYDALGFQRDLDVVSEEESMSIDEKTTTRVYDDAEKTVFASWVYVSPQEEVKVRYRYLLPFKIDSSSVNTYSILAQKQSGSIGSKFISNVRYPKDWIVEWKTSEEMTLQEDGLEFSGNLNTDKFFGVIFSKK
ncbi:DUF4012 domain-containing protein [Patescibacteria group bacterium]